jgi:hypothetical protein
MVLKYPQFPSEKPPGVASGKEKMYNILRQGQLTGIKVEEQIQILGVLGQHRRIIALLGMYQEVLLLEYMPDGSVADYLNNVDPQPPIQERLKWAW